MTAVPFRARSPMEHERDLPEPFATFPACCDCGSTPGVTRCREGLHLTHDCPASGVDVDLIGAALRVTRLWRNWNRRTA